MAIVAIVLFIIMYFWNGKPVNAVASHILVKTKDEADSLKKEIDGDKVKFAALAKEKSLCPSGKQGGGSLGRFVQGQMVPPFDRVVFDPENEIGVVYGPVETQFGWHLIVISERHGVSKN